MSFDILFYERPVLCGHASYWGTLTNTAVADLDDLVGDGEGGSAAGDAAGQVHAGDTVLDGQLAEAGGLGADEAQPCARSAWVGPENSRCSAPKAVSISSP
ncbi:hypothetical protein [Nonomuraea guangzhouensis]|uniref:Uncharacterized protein n=1 Tax=Nonomuraea guangzhouensis TaxID=1291555 RepID=A0ABW4GZ09_9ACTN|nr:hypothetical protein [Nonomuraea guangzhouensis]